MASTNPARDLFLDALDRPDPADRAAFLDAACPDPEIRRRVDALLAAHVQPDQLLDHPAVDAFTTPPELLPEPDGPPATPPGYELGDEIGRGGMGVVYRATHTALGRDVAVKLLQGRYSVGSAVATRFLDEARVTARLQHPGVPPVHEVGSLPDGRPFLAMKLVEGDTLDTLLKRRPDTGADRGRLVAIFEGVCQAVAFAHSRRVIHRDLKPANVMVGAFGEVQVMDWGLAKELGRADRDDTTEFALGPSPDDDAPPGRTPAGGSDRTRAGSVMGTPGFMAPEQARGELDRVDRRADVFGLGAVLCVILTGKPPFAGADWTTTLGRNAAGDLTDARAVLATCGAEPELVALCERCLSAEPEGRPADAGAVAMAVADLRTAAADRARRAEVEAAAAAARAASERKRWRTLLWVGGGLVAALLLGIAGTFSGLIWADAARQAAETAERETEAKRVQAETARAKAEAAERQTEVKRVEADAARAKAEAKEAEAKEANADTLSFSKFLVNDVLAAARPVGLQGGQGKDVTMAEALKAAEGRIDAVFAGRLKAEATARHAVGVTWRTLGRFDAAASHLKRAVELRQRELGPTAHDTLDSMNSLAVTYCELGRYAAAEPLYREVLAGHRANLGDTHNDTLATALNLAGLQYQLTRHREAEALFQDTLTKARAAHGNDEVVTLRAARGLGLVYSRTNRPAEAELLLREAVVGLRKAVGPNHSDALGAAESLAILLRSVGNLTEAGPLYEQVLDGRRASLGRKHSNTLIAANNVGLLRINQRRFDEAEELITEAVAGLRANHPGTHQNTLWAVTNLAVLRAAQGRTADLVPLYREVVDGYRAIYGGENRSTQIAVQHLARANFDLERWADAAPLFAEEYRHSRGRPADEISEVRMRLGLSLAGAGKVDDAVSHLLAAHAYLTGLSPPSEVGIVMRRRVTQSLADCYARLDRPADAAEWRAKLATLPPECLPQPRVVR
jgi:tetratricopeptide (TPR) repeat protein